MGFLDALLGRTKPVAANLDRLFSLPTAQLTLQAAESILSTGQAGVCFKPVVGSDFGDTAQEVRQLLALDDADEVAAGIPAGALPGAAPGAAGSLPAAGGPVKASLTERSDEYGYRWVVLDSADFETLVTRVHFVNSTLDEHGWGQQLLCSVFGFGPAPSADADASVTSAGATLYLVYLFKRGTFYPFVPMSGERRDSEAELRLKAELGSDLPIESDLDRWFPIWNLPLR